MSGAAAAVVALLAAASAAAAAGAVASATEIPGDEATWFCNHHMPWSECKQYLPAERNALARFMRSLGETSMPRPGHLSGRGIVMSGGQGHVLQALANLRVIRRWKCGLPVEFWHAFEVDAAHCEELAELGATCRTLQVPGVYPNWQTVLPAILSSSFSEFIWMDTDVTPLIDPERLFDTEAYRQDGALFWPDLWGMGCKEFGQTAWPRHVAWHLLGIEHNASDYHCAHEHEAGHLVVDKVRHWKALCLANYLSSRDFFAQVLWGYKDVFRFAWLKLNASNWLSPVRPGLVGAFLKDGRFFGESLVHFWPADDEFGSEHSGMPVALYVHQKKMPGALWSEVITFAEPLGQCVTYSCAPAYPHEIGAHVWRIEVFHPNLLDMLIIADHFWNEQYSGSRSRLEADPRLSPADVKRLHPERKQVAMDEWSQSIHACRCEYTDNRWLQLPSWMGSGMPVLGVDSHLLECDFGFEPTDNSGGTSSLDVCPVGHVARALLCSQVHGRAGKLRQAAEDASALRRILPRIRKCLRFSFWPMEFEELQNFVENTTGLEMDEHLGAGGELDERVAERLEFRGAFKVPFDRLPRFPRNIRRSFPIKDPICWGHLPRSSVESVPPAALGSHGGVTALGAQEAGVLVQTAALYCCDPNIPWRAVCFDEVYTEERCCNVAS